MQNPNPKLNVDLGGSRAEQLDKYCKLVKQTRSVVIRELVSALPVESSDSTGSKTDSLLDDHLFRRRLLRFLLIARTKLIEKHFKQEAQELWQKLHQFSK